MTQGRAAALAESVIETGYTSLVLDRLAKQACQITNAEQSSLLVRDRPRRQRRSWWRRALSPEEGIQRLCAGSGSQFDPDVVECLVDAIHEAPARTYKSLHANEPATRGSG